MKSFFTLLIFSALIFAACEDLDPNTFEPLPGDKPTFGADYLPLVPGDTLTYRSGQNIVGFTLSGDTTINGETYQALVPDQEMVDTLLYRKAGTLIFSREFSELALDSYLFLPILDTDKAVGETWRTTHLSSSGNPLIVEASIDELEATRTLSGDTYTDVVRVIQRISEEFFDPFTGESSEFFYGINVIWFARDVGIIERSYFDGTTVRLLNN